MHKLRSRIGLIKSVGMYYWKPFNQRRLRKFYGQFIHDRDLCFDIGAHVGNRTMAWQSLGARVIALEPQPMCVAYLRRRFRALENVVILEQAIAAMPGEVTLHISSANPTISTASDEMWRDQIGHDARYPIHWDTVTTVGATTLDQLIDAYGVPAFCKLDVENFELEALLGLSKPIPQLSFEYYPPHPKNILGCIDRIASLGDYEYNWSFGESLKLQSVEWLTKEALVSVLQRFTKRSEYGDIYARIRDTRPA